MIRGPFTLDRTFSVSMVSRWSSRTIVLEAAGEGFAVSSGSGSWSDGLAESSWRPAPWLSNSTASGMLMPDAAFRIVGAANGSLLPMS